MATGKGKKKIFFHLYIYENELIIYLLKSYEESQLIF